MTDTERVAEPGMAIQVIAFLIAGTLGAADKFETAKKSKNVTFYLPQGDSRRSILRRH